MGDNTRFHIVEFIFPVICDTVNVNIIISFNHYDNIITFVLDIQIGAQVHTCNHMKFVLKCFM